MIARPRPRLLKSAFRASSGLYVPFSQRRRQLAALGRPAAPEHAEAPRRTEKMKEREGETKRKEWRNSVFEWIRDDSIAP